MGAVNYLRTLYSENSSDCVFDGGPMFKLSVRIKIMMGILLSVAILELLFGRTIWAAYIPDNSANHRKTVSLRDTILMPKAQDLFVPYILVVPLHTTVAWRNSDTIMHVVMTTEQSSNFLNPQAFSFHVPAGADVQFSFDQPGLYHYYDSTRSSWNSALSRVAANRNAAHFPLAMDGVIWVQGPISGLSTVAINPILAGHDEFRDEFQAIRAIGGVTWHNFDQDPHFIGLVPGWSKPINPVEINLDRVGGTDEALGGEITTTLFEVPGLYYYHCRNHTIIDPSTNRVLALSMATDYPIPMESFVLVLGA